MSQAALKINCPDDFEEMATIYAEGNEELKDLLLYCFFNDIETIACCAGHWKKNNNCPYLAFRYNQKNEKYFAAFLNQLVDYGYRLRYSKLENNKSWFSITSSFNEPESASLFFKRIFRTMNSLENNPNYIDSVARDIQYYLDFIRFAEVDANLTIKKNEDSFLSSHGKSFGGYEYNIHTMNSSYNLAALVSGFSSKQQTAPFFRLGSISREQLIPNLKLLSEFIKQQKLFGLGSLEEEEAQYYFRML